MDLLRFLEDLYYYCEFYNLDFSNLSNKQIKNHIRIMLKSIVQNYH